MHLDLKTSDLVKVGKALHHKRREMNISLNYAEQQTKIRKRYIKALEAGEFAVIGFSVFYIGYLKTYSKFLEMDDHETLSLLDFVEDDMVLKDLRSDNIITTHDFHPNAMINFWSCVSFISLLLILNFYY